MRQQAKHLIEQNILLTRSDEQNLMFYAVLNRLSTKRALWQSGIHVAEIRKFRLPHVQAMAFRLDCKMRIRNCKEGSTTKGCKLEVQLH